MGVPALFRWLSNKYPKIVSPVIEEPVQVIDGQEIPLDISKPNPNGYEYDNLYLDMNGIVHPCSHPEDKPPPETEEQMMIEIFKYTDRVVNMARPRKILMIAVDGVAPRAKMNQQRSRRFRSAQEAKEKDESNLEFIKMLKAQNGGKLEDGREDAITKKTWDSNQITPGTPFMNTLAQCLQYCVPGEGEHKIMEFIRSQRTSPLHDPNTRHVLYGLDADLIMLGLATHEPHFHVLREDVFFQEAKARTCRLCGQKGHMAEDCKGEAKQKDGEFDEKDKAVGPKPYIWLHVSILREYLAAEMQVPDQSFPFDLERALDDWVFMCFFVGNDFLPHLPSLDIRENGIDTLISIWRDNIPTMGGYLTKDGHVDLARAQLILNGLAKQEDAIFRRRRQTEERKEAGAKRRKMEEENRKSRQSNGRKSPDYGFGGKKDNDPLSSLPLFAPGKGETPKDVKHLTHEMAVNRGAIHNADLANKSAAAALKSKLLGKTSPTEDDKPDEPVEETQNGAEVADSGLASALGKRKAELMEADATSTPGQSTSDDVAAPKVPSDEPPPDTVRLWEDGYADRYYEQKFEADPKDIAFRNKVAASYVEGLAWVLLYYFQGCPSWSWYYPYHYAPFAADFVDLDQMEMKFEQATPLKPYEQLMGVLPAASNSAIPKPFRPLMEEEDSEIIDFYPEDFRVDLNGKKFAWQGVAILPWIDIGRLLSAMAKKYPLLSEDEVARNALGKNVLQFSDRHPLYKDVATNFYSKRQGAPEFEIDSKSSEGLAGKVEKNPDYLPQSPLTYPLTEGAMPNLDDDHSISVHYEYPHSTHIHKSMLLNGVQMARPALDRNDIEQVKGRGSRGGRSRGGSSFRGNNRDNGRGGGPHSNDQRVNPFAAHIMPGFAPPPYANDRQGGEWSGPQGQRNQQYNGNRGNQGGNGNYGNNNYYGNNGNHVNNANYGNNGYGGNGGNNYYGNQGNGGNYNGNNYGNRGGYPGAQGRGNYGQNQGHGPPPPSHGYGAPPPPPGQYRQR